MLTIYSADIELHLINFWFTLKMKVFTVYTKGVVTPLIIEGLHDAIRSCIRMIFPRRLVSFCVARYREKTTKHVVILDLIYNMI